ncbi:hypothetical protein DXA62_12050 [Coprobacillus sp. OF03-2AA]|nr:hypothetical protein DXA62_12050 [Coprobacillus sp. OF03-2AA]
MTKEYKNKTLKVTFSDKLTVNYDVWRVPFNLDELNDENGFTYSFAYSLVAAFTFDEVAGENSLSEELKALANILIIYERKGLRELLFELVLKDEGYQDLETFYEYYRWVLRDCFRQQSLMSSTVLSYLLPHYKEFVEPVDKLNSSLKKVDERMYKVFCGFINEYFMKKLDELSDEEKRMVY